MSMKIITGYRDEPHVSSQQERDTNIGIFGGGTYILEVGSEMAATVISANEVDIADGILVAEGCTAAILRGTSEAMAIDNGTQGMLRTDLIVARYTMDSGTAIEDMQLEVIKGTPVASNPATPSYTTGSIAAGDTTVDFPLYEVHLNGISIDSVTCLVDTVAIAKGSTVSALQSTVGNTAMGTVATTITGAIKELVNKIGSTAMGTTATTITGAINELLTKINTNISRISALETKTAGIVKTSMFSVSEGARDNKQLASVATYMLIVNTAYPSDTMKGLYLIGVSGDNQISIKAVSNASAVAISDAGSGLLRIVNNGNAYIRCTLITTYN